MMMINFSIIFIIFITNIDGSINQNLYHRSSNAQKITFGAILPKTSLITLQRQYYKVKQNL